MDSHAQFADPDAHLSSLSGASLVQRFGRVVRVMPTYIEATGLAVPVGGLCRVAGRVLAEVSRVDVKTVTLALFHAADGIRVGDRVDLVNDDGHVSTGDGILGRVVDPLGLPLDGLGPLKGVERSWPVTGRPVGPLERLPPEQIFETGIRAIDTLLTLGVGQRIGVFAGSGVGKTTLLAGLSAHADADVCVFCLVGERGREVHEFWTGMRSSGSLSRAVLIAATSDQSAMLRVRAVWAALAHAEYFRAQGKRVLLVLDSITRFALALREIGLAAGEPPTIRAYTPSVFAQLPRVVERCGAVDGQGAITAVMTVLAETDDVDDPMSETMRALLDGHIVLTRNLAEQGHYPAIDIPRSISRVFRAVVPEQERMIAVDAIGQLSLYDMSRTLIEAGIYVPGSQPALDRALSLRPKLLAFLRQDLNKPESRREALAALRRIEGLNP